MAWVNKTAAWHKLDRTICDVFGVGEVAAVKGRVPSAPSTVDCMWVYTRRLRDSDRKLTAEQIEWMCGLVANLAGALRILLTVGKAQEKAPGGNPPGANGEAVRTESPAETSPAAGGGSVTAATAAPGRRRSTQPGGRRTGDKTPSAKPRSKKPGASDGSSPREEPAASARSRDKPGKAARGQ